MSWEEERRTALCDCCLLPEYPSVDAGRAAVSIRLLGTHRRLRDCKQTLIFGLQRQKKGTSRQTTGGGRRNPVGDDSFGFCSE